MRVAYKIGENKNMIAETDNIIVDLNYNYISFNVKTKDTLTMYTYTIDKTVIYALYTNALQHGFIDLTKYELNHESRTIFNTYQTFTVVENGKPYNPGEE